MRLAGGSRARWGVVWAGVTLAATLIAVAVEQGTRPPAPAPADAPAGSFSDGRALAVARHLSEDIGIRVAGTEACDRAADYLVDLLRGIDGIEVETQRAQGVHVFGHVAVDYRVRNVMARIPGKRRDALLVSSHYDSPPESAGAADAAMAVGVMIELARILARGDALESSVILLFNGGEEVGLAGAHGFLQHPWAEEVRAFVNLEAAGAGGLAILFQAGPGNPWLAEAYARVPRPFGSIVGQDLFQAGAIRSDTDGRVYRELAGWPGLDLALFEDGYAYHTALDRVDRIERGSAQGMGENVLALVRALAARALPAGDEARAPIYFDVLGRVMFVHGPGAALAASLVGLALVLAALALARGRRAITLASWAWGLGLGALGLLAALALAVAAGLVTASLLGGPHGWFARPWLAVWAYGGAAATGAVLPQALWARRRARAGADQDAGALAAWAGGATLWAVLAVALALAGLGSGYVATVWTFAGALGLAAAARVPLRWRWAPLAAAWLVGMLITIQFGAGIFELFVPMAGRMRTPFAMDLLIAACVAIPVLACGVLTMAAVHVAGRPGWTLAALGLVTVVGLVACAWAFPYSAWRPKRVHLEQIDRPGGSEVRLVSHDFLTAEASGLPRLLAEQTGIPWTGAAFAASPSGLALPEVALEVGTGSGPGPGEIVLKIAGGDHDQIIFELPRERIAGWSLPVEPAALAGHGPLYLKVVGQGRETYELRLRMRGDEPEPVPVPEPVIVIVDLVYPSVPPSLARLQAGLPPWVTSYTRHVTRRELALDPASLEPGLAR